MKMTGLLGAVLVKNCGGDASKANTCDIVAPLYGNVGSLTYQPATFPIKAGSIGGVPKVGVTLKAGLTPDVEKTTTTLKFSGSDGRNVICVKIMTTPQSDMKMLPEPQVHPASSSLPGLSASVANSADLAVTFQDCGDADTDAVVTDVVPKSLSPGASTTVTGSGTLKHDVTGGAYTMTMTGLLGAVLVKNCGGDASKANTCDIVAPLYGNVGSLTYQPATFPIKAGSISGVPKVGVTLKAGLTPDVERTTTTLQFSGSDGRKVICVKIMTTPQSDMKMLLEPQVHPASSSLPRLSALLVTNSADLAVTFQDCGDADTDAVVTDVVP